MMRRNLTHQAPPEDYWPPRRRSPSRKCQSRTERSPARHRISHRGSSRPSEKYTIHPMSPKHARSPSPPHSPSRLAKRLRKAEAGRLSEREHERFNGRRVDWDLQQCVSGGDIRSDRKEILLGRSYTERSSRSWYGSSPSERDRRSRHRHSSQHAGGIRDEKKVIEGCDRYHTRGNNRSMHRENDIARVGRMTANDSTGHMFSRSSYETSPSDQHRRTRHRSYLPQCACDTRHVEKVIEGRERNHSRGNHRSMYMENDTERMERISGTESPSHRFSRLKQCTTFPSDRHRRSRHTNFSPQHAGYTTYEEKLIKGHQRNYRRESDRSMFREKCLDRENETEQMERRIAKFSSGLTSSSSRHEQSTSPLNGHSKTRHQTHSSQPDADTRAYNEVPEWREAKDGLDVNDSVSMMRASGEVLEAQKKQKPMFELSGKVVVEGNRFRGDIPMKKLISSYNNDGNEDNDYERTQRVCRLTPAPRKKKLLVFDLNGLLVYRAFCFNKNGIPKDRIPDGKCGNHLVFKRDFAEEFMLFCLERFEVGIWTSAMEKNVDGVLDCVMENLRSRLIFVWDQQHCTDSGFKSREKKMKPLFFKELKKVWDHLDGKFSASNTLLLDDEPYKALLNPPYTGIFVDPFIPDKGTDNVLDPKRELGKYLAGLAFAEDVQLYVKDNPFGQPAISSKHPEWNFYSDVLEKLGMGHC